VATWRDVCELAGGLLDVEETTTYRKPALKVKGKLFAWMSPHADALVIRCDPAERELMIAAKPELYYVTPHYEPHAMVLVRLGAVADREELRQRIEESWLLAAPSALTREYTRESAST